VICITVWVVHVIDTTVVCMPLHYDNYRGITISPMISKVFEFCELNKLTVFLEVMSFNLVLRKIWAAQPEQLGGLVATMGWCAVVLDGNNNNNNNNNNNTWDNVYGAIIMT